MHKPPAVVTTLSANFVSTNRKVHRQPCVAYAHYFFKRVEYMELIKGPTYVKNFQCSNRWCSDTCCRGFDIELDDMSVKVYNSITGVLKDLIQKGLIQKNGKTYIRSEENCCVFLNANNLCELQIVGGESALCYTCRTYPRFHVMRDNVSFTGLSLSCPTAYFLIIDGDESTYPFYSLEDNKIIAEHSALIENEYFLIDEVVELFENLDKREFDFDDYFSLSTRKSEIVKNTLSKNETLNLCRYFYFRYQEGRTWENISYWFIALTSILMERGIITHNEIYKLAKEVEHSEKNITFLSKGFTQYTARISAIKEFLTKED